MTEARAQALMPRKKKSSLEASAATADIRRALLMGPRLQEGLVSEVEAVVGAAVASPRPMARTTAEQVAQAGPDTSCSFGLLDMERYAVIQEADNIVRTIVAVAPDQAWHCDDNCFPVLLNAGENCDMGWTYYADETPRFVP
jgi:hypothetical protein